MEVKEVANVGKQAKRASATVKETRNLMNRQAGRAKRVRCSDKSEFETDGESRQLTVV